MTSLARSLVLVALVFGLGGISLAGPTKEEIAKAIQQLGDNDFAIREKASTFLWTAGKAAEAALTEAAKSTDTEVARRAGDILEKFKYGIYPDTPEKVLQLIAEFRAGDANARRGAIHKLVPLGTRGYEVAFKLIGAEENADLRRVLFQEVAQQSGQAAATLMAEGNFPAVEELLEVGTATEEESALRNYAVFLLLRGRLDARIDHYKSRAELPGGTKAAHILSFLLRAKGDLAGARKAAEKAGKESLVRAILSDQGDWKELARRLAQSERAKEEDGLETLGLQAASERLAGNLDEFVKYVVAIRKAVDDNPGENWSARVGARNLLLNERPADALAVLEKGQEAAMLDRSDTYVMAFEVLAGQLRFREALELADKAKGDNGKTMPEVEIRRARTLFNLGERDQAMKLFAQVAEEGKTGKELFLADLVEAEFSLGLKDQAFAHCARMLARVKEEDFPYRGALYPVFPQQAETAAVWWRLLRRKYPDDEATATMTRLRRLLSGKTKGQELDDLLAEVEDATPKAKGTERDKVLAALAETRLLAGPEDQARTYLEKLAERSAAAPVLLRLGDLLAGKKLWKEAAQCYGKAAVNDNKDPLPLYLFGWALVQSGQDKEGNKRQELARLLPLGNEDARAELAEALAKRGLTEAARTERALILQLSSADIPNLRVLLARANEAAVQRDYLKAAAGYQQLLLGCLQSMRWYMLDTSFYQAVPHEMHRYRARGLLAAGNVADALAEIRRCQAILPTDVDLPIDLIPGLEKHGREKEADDMFNRVFAAYDKLCTDYPKSGWGHNSLAWLAARCHRKLDQGLVHANKAVELHPKEAAYLDTLAEVHFQQGDKAKALELMKKCVELEPQTDYFRKQLQRIEAGDPTADLPPSS